MIKYHFNENIFSIIDSNEKAYWIGFLYADGSISKENNRISIGLKETDVQQLINFENFLQIPKEEQKIEYNKKTNSIRFGITRKQLAQDLRKIGFTANKSYDTTIDVWNNIPVQFKKDFILGLWDGDGGFSFSAQKTQIAHLISNNDLLIDTIVNYINSQLGKNFCKKKERTPGDPYPRIRISCNKAKIFGDWLYKNINYPVLKRKYDNYKQMHIGSRAHFGLNNPNNKGIYCIETQKCYITAKECAIREFGVNNPGTVNSICMVCRGERKQTKNKHFRFLTEEERRKLQHNAINDF